MSRSIIAFLTLLAISSLAFSIDVSSCQAITSAGTYDLINDITGAGVAAGSGSGCIVIRSSNVVFDCHGYSMDFNAALPPTARYGILVNDNSSSGISNVVVRNCPNITGYSNHVEIWNTSYSTFSNITIYNSYPEFGMYLRYNSSYNTISDINGYNGYSTLSLLQGSNNNAITRVYTEGDTFGIHLDTNGNSLSYANTTDSTLWGIDIGGSDNVVTYSSSSGNDIGYIVFGNNNELYYNDGNGNTEDGFAISGGNNNVLNYNLADSNTENGFRLSGTGNNLTLNNATGNGLNGFRVGGSNNRVNCLASGNTGNGVYIYGDLNTVTNCDSFSNGGHGYLIEGGDNNLISNSEAHSNTLSGVAITNNYYPPSEGPATLLPATGNEINNVDSYGNTQHGFYAYRQYGFVGLSDNDFIGCNASNNGVDGFNIHSLESSTLSNNYASGNDQAFDLVNDTDLDLNTNTAEGNADGFSLSGSTYNRLNGNTAYDNMDDGFVLFSNSDYNNLTSNNASTNGEEGFIATTSDYNRYTGNTAEYNTASGFWLSSNSDFNTLSGNEMYGNGKGLYLYSSQYNAITGNLVHDNSLGVELYWNANDAQFSGNEVYGNGPGIFMRDSSKVSFSGDHIYDNANGFEVRGLNLGCDYTMDGVIFDSDAGTYTDYTNISVSDYTNDSYLMNWDSEPAALPFPMLSFNQKFIDIGDTGSATDSIESITWNWLDSEVGSFDESRLQLWDYESSWSLLNATPDTLNNELSLTDLSGFSTFAILAGGACPAPITSPGVYTLTGDLEGSTNNASPIVGTACIKIASSDVVLDCDGYSITNNGTAGITHAVVSNGTFTNVTVMNCPNMSDYTRGVYYYQTSNGAIRNSSAYNNAHHGFLLDLNSNNNVVENCHSEGNSYYGFYLSNSDNNNLTGCSAASNVQRGFWLQNSDYNRVVESTASDNVYSGFMTTTSTGNVFLDSNASGASQEYGFYLDRGGSHDVIGCNAVQSDIGFYVNQSNNNELIDVNASGCDDGVRIESSTGNTVDPSYFCDNDRQGVYLINSSSNTISDSTMCRNGDDGIYFEGSSNNFVLGNAVYENSGRGINLVDSSDGNNVTGNNVTDNVQHGIRLENSDNNDIYENYMELNSDGIYLRDSDYNVVVRNTANSNDMIGIRLGTAIGPSSSYNTLDNNTVDSNGWVGIGGGYSSNNDVTNNLVGSNGVAGIALVNESNLNWVAYNTVVGNSGIGIGIQDNSGPNTIEGNYVESSAYGLIVNRSNSTSSLDNEITLASLSGIYLYDSEGSGFLRDHLYNNTVDMEIESAFSWGFNMAMDNVIFDNPAGNMTNYSNVTVDDFVENDGNHRFSWSAEPATPLPNFRSFSGKYLYYERYFGGPVVDLLIMSWAESELAPDYTEGDLRLVYHDGAWGYLNTTPDETNNELSYENISTSATLGIWEFTGIEDTDDTTPEDELSIAFTTGCNGSIVTVTSGGDDVGGASVQVFHKDALYDVATGSTDSDGDFTFMGCGIPVKILVSKTGYQSDSTTKTLVACGECELECGEDADCSDAEHCLNNMCQRVDCSCGVIESHKCSPYECCQDSDCDSLQACIQNVCVDNYDCSSDEDCESSEYCKIAEGAVAGFCEDVTGLCGEADDHEWVQFDCGDEEGCPDCPTGYICEENVCEPVRDIKGPDSGFVGDNVTVNATEGGGVCADCEVQIKLPDGKILNGRTDSNGNLELPLNLEGSYEITLLKDGVPVESIKVQSLPKPVIEDEEPATQVLDDTISLIFLLLLLVIMLAGIIYWRRGTKK